MYKVIRHQINRIMNCDESQESWRLGDGMWW